MGVENGRIRFTRTGSLAKSLTVLYAASGTAINGQDYQALSGSFVIPAGRTYAKLKIIPLRDPSRTEPRHVTIQLLGDPAGDYVRGNHSKAEIIVE